MQVPLLVENHNLRTEGTQRTNTAINQSSSCITIIIMLSDTSSNVTESIYSIKGWQGLRLRDVGDLVARKVFGLRPYPFFGGANPNPNQVAVGGAVSEEAFIQ
jgi:hypothetical protein